MPPGTDETHASVRNASPTVNHITIRRGRCKDKSPETIATITIRNGESLAVVGPTGSGKSQLLSDIEQMARGDTVSRRRITMDARSPSAFNQREGLIAQLTQKTGFIMDCSVAEFLTLHAQSRGKSISALSDKVIAVANTLCGEPVRNDSRLQVLSGGQARALMIADIAYISDAPVVLIDEIENAGIDKLAAMDVLSSNSKLVVISTHDPVLTLRASRRLVMKNGGMDQLQITSPDDYRNLQKLQKFDNLLTRTREMLRTGRTIDLEEPNR